MVTHVLKVRNYLLGEDTTVSNRYNSIKVGSVRNFGADISNLIIVYTKWIGLWCLKTDIDKALQCRSGVTISRGGCQAGLGKTV